MPRPVFVPMPSASSSHFIDCCISQATATGPFTGREPCHSSIHLLGCVHPPEGRGIVKMLTSGAQLNEKSTEYPVFQSAYINEYVSWVLLLVTASNSEHTTHSRCVCEHSHICVYVFRSHRLMSGVFLYCSPLYFLRYCLLLNLYFVDWLGRPMNSRFTCLYPAPGLEIQICIVAPSSLHRC